jgi:hypothetical protein
MEMLCEMACCGKPTLEFSNFLMDETWQVRALDAIVATNNTTGVAACLKSMLAKSSPGNFGGLMTGLERLVQKVPFCREIMNTGVVGVLGQRMKHPPPLVRVVVCKVLLRLQEVDGPGFLMRDREVETVIRGHARMDVSLVVRELCRQLIRF